MKRSMAQWFNAGFIHNSPIVVSPSVRFTLEDGNIISYSVALNGKTVTEYELSLKRTSNGATVDKFKVLSQILTEGIEEIQEISLSRQQASYLELRKLLTGDKSVIRLTAIFGMCLSVGVTIFGEHLTFEVITVNIHLIKFYQLIKVYICFVLAIRIVIKTKMNYRNRLLKLYIYLVFQCNDIYSLYGGDNRLGYVIITLNPTATEW